MVQADALGGDIHRSAFEGVVQADNIASLDTSRGS